MMNFALTMMRFVSKTMNFVLKMMNCRSTAWRCDAWNRRSLTTLSEPVSWGISSPLSSRCDVSLIFTVFRPFCDCFPTVFRPFCDRFVSVLLTGARRERLHKQPQRAAGLSTGRREWVASHDDGMNLIVKMLILHWKCSDFVLTMLILR